MKDFNVLALFGETGSDLLERSLTLSVGKTEVIQFNNLTSTKLGCLNLVVKAIQGTSETIVLHGAEIPLQVDVLNFQSIKTMAYEHNKKLIMLYSNLPQNHLWILDELCIGLLGRTKKESEFMYGLRKKFKPGQFIDLKGESQYVGMPSYKKSSNSNLVYSS